MADSDQLFELRNLFLVGNYQAAINAGLSLGSLPERVQVERDVLIYRSYIAKGDYAIVLDEIKNNAANPLQAVRCLATYLSKDQDIALESIKEWLNEPHLASEDTIQLIAGTIYFLQGDYDEVLRTMHRTNSLEGHALLVQAYLQISRLNLAKKELDIMKSVDEDATITQLASAWVYVASGGEENLSQAMTIYSELIEKWNPTPLLLNGVATCHMHQLDKKDSLRLAERELLKALEKNPSDPETLVNLIVCCQHQNKPVEVINRYASQLKARAPTHPWVKALASKEASFDLHAARFSLS